MSWSLLLPFVLFAAGSLVETLLYFLWFNLGFIALIFSLAGALLRLALPDRGDLAGGLSLHPGVGWGTEGSMLVATYFLYVILRASFG